MARLPSPGADDGLWGGILNDYLTTSHNYDGTLKDGSVTKSTLTTDVQQLIDGKADGSSLSSVAYSGSYNDLIDKPAALGAHTHTSSDVTDFNAATSAAIRGALVAGENVSLDYDLGTGATIVSAVAEGTPGPQGETGEPGPVGPYAPYSLPTYILEANQTVSDVPSDFPEGGLVFKKTN